MKTNTLLALFLFLTLSLPLYPQDAVMYRLLLTDKGDSGYTIDNPSEYLSQKAIDRRTHQGFPIDETDLPISPDYFRSITTLGAEVMASSKWLATITVRINNDDAINAIASLPFVSEYHPVWRETSPKSAPKLNKNLEKDPSQTVPTESFPNSHYGAAYKQINQLNGIPLHQMGYTGQGITIAVMDGGYLGTDLAGALSPDAILEVKEFTHENDNPYLSYQDHGTKVLSCMLANDPGTILGTAPGASYYLFKTEANDSEYPVEEDYWVTALEYADSLGVDIVSTSLGYHTFHDTAMNHRHEHLNGTFYPASRAASMAASKGMILCNAAGNEGNNTWKKISVPSDADNILTVGSVNSLGNRSGFSSTGNTADHRIKPDVMAMGSSTAIIGSYGLVYRDGTSFACPLISGMTACLWQALPELNSLQIIDLIQTSSSQYLTPDSLMGYGIPNFYNAFLSGKEMLTINEAQPENTYMQIDSSNCRIQINPEITPGNTSLTIYNLSGNKVYQSTPPAIHTDYTFLTKGIYIACLRWENQASTLKFAR